MDTQKTCALVLLSTGWIWVAQQISCFRSMEQNWQSQAIRKQRMKLIVTVSHWNSLIHPPHSLLLANCCPFGPLSQGFAVLFTFFNPCGIIHDTDQCYTYIQDTSHHHLLQTLTFITSARQVWLISSQVISTTVFIPKILYIMLRKFVISFQYYIFQSYSLML